MFEVTSQRARTLIIVAGLCVASAACSTTGGNSLFDGSSFETACDTVSGPRYTKRPVSRRVPAAGCAADSDAQLAETDADTKG